MKTIHYHKTETVNYCHAEDEIPRNYWWDFRDWMEDNEYHAVPIKGIDRQVYNPRHVKEYLQMRGFRCVEIIEDEGEVLRDIVNGKSKLEIMD